MIRSSPLFWLFIKDRLAQFALIALYKSAKRAIRSFKKSERESNSLFLFKKRAIRTKNH